jgi:hypothetical protein
VVALAIVLSVVVLLLAVLVAGLLRSHADILKALHELGVGVGEPNGTHENGGGNDAGPRAAPSSVHVPLTMGPPLPGERNSTSAPTIVGVAPNGDALAVNVEGGGHLTLLAFLSSGCASCAEFWTALQQPGDLGLPARTRLVVVTKGPEMEIPAEVASHVRSGLSVVMSTDAWGDYEVPGSPFFVLVDGGSGRRIGEGVANHFRQVVELVRRAEADSRDFSLGTRSRPYSDGLSGPEREMANDRELIAAGIRPGDPSLYPSSLDDLYGPHSSETLGTSSGLEERFPHAANPANATKPADPAKPADPVHPAYRSLSPQPPIDAPTVKAG